MINCKENSELVEGGRQTEKDNNVVAYIFQFHLDRWIHRRSCILDDTHPPGFRVGEEGRGRV